MYIAYIPAAGFCINIIVSVWVLFIKGFRYSEVAKIADSCAERILPPLPIRTKVIEAAQWAFYRRCLKNGGYGTVDA